ncbi:hypothetical protein GIX45_00380 [Erwinia sp. CPCC 100877]|nr:hypothetical protein [Erwinia sp. CPCC 100877]
MIRKFLLSILPVFLFTLTNAQAAMISSSELGNDPAKAKLCAARSTIKGHSVPFEIDSRYVKSSRAMYPDITFIAIDGLSPQLVECYQRSGTGRYEPATYTPEGKVWRLASTPQKFEPGLGTAKGMDMASKACWDAAIANTDQQGFVRAVTSRVVEINKGNSGWVPGKMVAGKKSQRYDIVVEGSAFYQSGGPDLKERKYSCLLSSMLDVKATKISR